MDITGVIAIVAVTTSGMLAIAYIALRMVHEMAEDMDELHERYHALLEEHRDFVYGRVEKEIAKK